MPSDYTIQMGAAFNCGCDCGGGIDTISICSSPAYTMPSTIFLTFATWPAWGGESIVFENKTYALDYVGSFPGSNHLWRLRGAVDLGTCTPFIFSGGRSTADPIDSKAYGVYVLSDSGLDWYINFRIIVQCNSCGTADDDGTSTGGTGVVGLELLGNSILSGPGGCSAQTLFNTVGGSLNCRLVDNGGNGLLAYNPAWLCFDNATLPVINIHVDTVNPGGVCGHYPGTLDITS